MEGRKWPNAVALACFAIGWPTLLTQAGQKVQYELKWLPGQSYDARIVADSNVVQETQGQEARSQMSLGIGYRLDVNAIDTKGVATVDCTVTWVKYRQKSPTMEMGYDSADKDHPIPAEARDSGPAGLLGEKFTVRITRQGQAQDILGLETIRRNIEKKTPEGPTRQQVMEGHTEQQLAGLIREYFLRPLAIYSSTPVGIGDSWDRRDSPETAPYDYATKWTLKSRTKGVAVIDTDAVITPKPPSEQKGAAMSGRSHGQIEIDELTGRVLRSKTTQTLSGQMTVGSSAFGVKTESVTTFEMTERKMNAR